jgi:hypothetical protein
LLRPSAILFLAIYLFNLVGYNGVFHLLTQRSEQRFAQRIDTHAYSDAQLLEIRIPFQVPYFDGRGEEELVNGAVDIDGAHYNYVKRKFSRDTMYVYCLLNQEVTRLAQGKISMSAVVSDFTNDHGKNQASDAAKNKGGIDQHMTVAGIDLSVPPAAKPIPHSASDAALCSICIDLPEQPPRAQA